MGSAYATLMAKSSRNPAPAIQDEFKQSAPRPDTMEAYQRTGPPMKTLSMALMAGLAFAAAPAFAEGVELSQRYSTCMNQADGITIDMHACIAAEYERQDGRLNLAYKQLSNQLSDDRKKQLLAAQRLWIQFRGANCAFYADPDGGTLANLDGATCELEATALRAAELERFLDR